MAPAPTLAITVNNLQRINLALVLVIIVVAAAVYLAGGRQPDEAPLRLTSVDPAGVSSITVEQRGGMTIRFVKAGQVWAMTAPVQGPANPARINAMLAILQSQSFARIDSNAIEPGRFDLLQPAVVLTLNDQRFTFGGSNPLEGRRYVLYDGTVHLLNDNLYHQLLQPAEFFLAPPSG